MTLNSRSDHLCNLNKPKGDGSPSSTLPSMIIYKTLRDTRGSDVISAFKECSLLEPLNANNGYNTAQ